GDLAARGVDEHVGQKPRGDTVVASLAEQVVLCHDAHDAADCRADEDSGTRWVDAFDASISPCLACGGDRQDDVPLEAAGALRADDRRGVETLDLRGDPNRVLARVERLDPVDAAPARDRSLP